MDTTVTDVMPSAMPSEAEIAAWNDLPRDEQVRRMRLALMHPDRAKSSPHTMDDILALARKRVADGKHG
jgi:hypothetical protein